MRLGEVTLIAGKHAAVELARHLQSPSRRHPTVVVSVPAARTEPNIDALEIASEVAGLADVYLVPTGVESWALSEELPDKTEVYGGAGRVYPVGLDWVRNPYASPLRFAFNSVDGKSSTDRLIGDALRMANQAGLLTAPVSSRSTRVSGSVVGVLAGVGRAVVRLESGLPATIHKEFTFPDVPLRRLLQRGMSVTGTLDVESKRLDIRSSARSGADCLAEYVVGAVVLAQVDTVAEHTATLLLHPGFTVQIRVDEVTSNPADVLTSLMSPGEVLPARIVQRGDRWKLSLIDIDDDEEPVPAPCIFDGGPPWLDLDDVPERIEAPEEFSTRAVSQIEPAQAPESHPGAAELRTEPQRVPTPRPPSPLLLDRRRSSPRSDGQPAAKPVVPAAISPQPPTPGPAARQLGLDLDAARAEISSAVARTDWLEKEFAALRAERDLMARRLHAVERDLHDARSTIENQRTELRKAKQRQAKGVRPVMKALTADSFFMDKEEQFRFEVTNAWARRIPAPEKPARPLGEYLLGADFLDSVSSVEGVERSKVVDVVVEILTGIVAEMAGRELHRLRTGEGGDAAPVVREDGAISWRAALQVSTPSARRLHYWRLRDGSIELSRVVLHDDMTP